MAWDVVLAIAIVVTVQAATFLLGFKAGLESGRKRAINRAMEMLRKGIQQGERREKW